MRLTKHEKIKIISITVCFLLLNIMVHLCFPVLARILEKKEIDFKKINFVSSFFHFKELKHLNVFLYIELFIGLICAYIWIIGKKQYTSDQIRVTDKISIPVSAGQGQFGTARFATKKEIISFIGFQDFSLSDHEEFTSLYAMNKKEDKEIAEITEEELSSPEKEESDTGSVRGVSEGSDIEKLKEFVKYVGRRKDIRYLIRSELTVDDLKNNELMDLHFDEYHTKLTRKELTEFLIINGKDIDPRKKELVYEFMVKKRYETVEQLREIRYAIEDGCQERHLKLFADNRFTGKQMKLIRLAYKDDRIMNKKYIEKYMVDPELSESQMKEIKKALGENSISEIEAFAHRDIPDFLMKEMREKGKNTQHQAVSHREEKKEEVIGQLKKGGLVIGKDDIGGKERIYSITDDLHSLVIGETGSGKTRNNVLQSIVSMILAGENIVVTDVKGELSEYTSELLRWAGYETVLIDFREPLKSTRFNFLEPVIEAVNKGEYDDAVELAWDITSQLVGETKGEPIWQNGEAAMIAGGIIAVVFDNRDNKDFQNLANVYYFLANMCRLVVIGKEMVTPIEEYMRGLDDNHPAKQIFSIAEIAPSRTRGSFYTSALTTLRLFTLGKIADMTRSSEFRLESLAYKRTAVFVILPEERDTYNEIASLYIGLQYGQLSRQADKRGGRIPIRCNFLCDEFGNFPAIPGFSQMITVARSKGVRLNLFIQDIQQLQKAYGKETADTIMGNCGIWIYLRTGNKETLELISSKLSQYTVSSYSLSGSTTKHMNSNSSYNIQLSGRNLLNPNELALFENPYSLVLSKIHPMVMKSADFSKWQFVKLTNMGTKEKDTKLRYLRQKKRHKRVCGSQRYWKLHEEIISKKLKEMENRLNEQ